MDTERLLDILDGLRRETHTHVEGDTFYSCPLDPEYCGEKDPECDCGLAEHNALIDEAITIIRGKV